MKHVGVRELKNRLSKYLRDVRAGEGVLVTDRGEVVAELLPPGRGARGDLPAAVAELAARGRLTAGTDVDPTVYRRLPRLTGRRRKHSALALLDAERGAR